MFDIREIQRNPEGISFDQELDLTDELCSRNAEILAVSPIHVQGGVRYEAGLFFLDYQMDYVVTLASSRSMRPVALPQSHQVVELFVAEESTLKDMDLVDEELVLVIEGEQISLAESVADNILLEIPLKVLTPDEELSDDLPKGQHWSVLTEESYQEVVQEKKAAASPFAQLQGLFEEETE